MPVLSDRLWWAVNWPWMTVWLATALGALWLLGLRIAGHRRRTRPSEMLVNGRTCLYLDDRTIMDQFQMNRYEVALRKEVEQRTRTGLTGRILATLPLVSPEATFDSSREVVTKYIEAADEPITVIGLLVDGLERAEAIVHANLRRGTVRRNAALDKVRAQHDRGRPTRLSGTGEWFVLLTADFVREAGPHPAPIPTSGLTVFTTPYGPQATARVRVSCRTAGLREPVDAFPALCLGKVGAWHPESETLDVRPLAIFT
ncbi:hypothetical protein [Streptomyces sp. NBC_01190]|uniref:hypothetical protein n=1 Tax=Streptomyces sp. NBC_01190 TaxID=2903767 RepID=UPI00386F10FC|nr:hypothetical protein OG519_33905 [Streptomyces sp. NBC_01190]